MPGLDFLDELDQGMEISQAKTGQRSAAAAVSADGEVYTGSYFGSQTRLTTVEAEVVALIQATRQCDYDISSVIALYENSDERGDVVSPVVIKSLIDFATRTSQKVEYRAVNARGRTLFHSDDIAEEMPFYRPEAPRATYIDNGQRQELEPWNRVMGVGGDVGELHFMANRGLTAAFPITDANTRYGAVAVSREGKAHIAGQYSGLNDRTIHAEMCAVVAAKMAGVSDIAELAVVSSRAGPRPTEVCGCCRQFLVEHTDSTQLTVTRFSSAEGVGVTHRLDELLPDAWEIPRT